MNTKTLCALTAMFAATLILANFNVANAEVTMTKDANDKRQLDTIERKKAEAANKMISILKEYEQTLSQFKFANPSTEKRVMEDTKFIQNKISGIVELFENRDVTYLEVTKTPDEPYLKKMAQGKVGGNLPDYYRVTYQVHASDYNLSDVQVMVSSDLDSKQKSVGNIFAENSNKATFLIKAKDPSSITAEIIR